MRALDDDIKQLIEDLLTRDDGIEDYLVNSFKAAVSAGWLKSYTFLWRRMSCLRGQLSRLQL